MPKKPWKLAVLDSKESVFLNDHKLIAVTYEPNWQGVRLSLSFTENNISRSLAMMKAYADAAISDNEYICRLVRARNTLTSIPVYRSYISVEKADLIVAEKDMYTELIEVTDKSIIWDWNEARMQTYAMYNAAYRLFDQMRADLRRRSLRPGKKPELRYYLGIIEEVIDAKETT